MISEMCVKNERKGNHDKIRDAHIATHVSVLSSAKFRYIWTQLFTDP